MFGRLFCAVGWHRWQKRFARGTSGQGAYLACARCNTERYTPGPEQTNGMSGIGGW